MAASNSNPTRTKRGSIPVLLADDHGVVRDGLAALMRHEEDIKVVAAVADAAAALREARRLQPRVAVMGRVEGVRPLIDNVPGISIVVVSTASSPGLVRRALEAGALGYLSRESSGEDVLRAIRAVATGKRYLGNGIAETIVDEQREALTATERNILRLVAEGKSNAEVAEIIGLSARTVETYRLRMMRKLGIGDLASLVKYAIREGIASLE